MAKTKLSEYSAKRSFELTSEPPPTAGESPGGPLLFVIQQHAASHLHYDLRLECDGVLKSWAVPKGPSLDPREKRLAMQTEDHPYAYASFEGVIPAGQYGAGEMIVWDCGVYSPDEGKEDWFHDRFEAERRVRAGLQNGKLSFLLRGHKTKGSFALVRTASKKSWLLIKHKDRFVSDTALIGQPASVLSGLTLPDIKGQKSFQRMDAPRLVPAGKPTKLPVKVAPMQAELGDAAFNNADWMWEPKLDGYRALAWVAAENVALRSRQGIELTADFPSLVSGLRGQAVNGMILDGEIVAFDAAGKPSFGALQNRASSKVERAVYYCFDLLFFAGVDLRKMPYVDRRRYLAQCLLPSPTVQLVHAGDDGVALYEAAMAAGLEGVVGKHKRSAYESGRRSPSWIKIKATQSSEFVIGGYTKGKGARAALGALLVGYREEGKLRYASHVGSGLDDAAIVLITERLSAIRRTTCPFSEKPELNGPTVWVEPRAVAEVKFQNWTDDGHLRAPVFLRLRDDVEPKDVKRERGPSGTRTADTQVEEVVQQLQKNEPSLTLVVGAERIRLTHLDRVYWPANAALDQPALTKRDLLRYLAQVSYCMIPHLQDRPLTMIRMPDGIRGQRFFQKHWAQERPGFVETITVFSGHKEDSHDYLLCNNLPTLLWLAQSGTLEFHVWHSRAKVAPDSLSKTTDYASSLVTLADSVLNYPDYVLFDIDPYIYSGKEAPGAEPELNDVAFEKGKEIAFRLRELLLSMSLDAIVKTSGKTGLHVFVPIRRTIDFEAARHVSEAVGRHLMGQHPEEITLEWSVPKRTGKIFMDYNMNVRGKTLNVAYSPRGEPGAPVSMPLTWDELAKAHPLDFRITNVVQRLATQGDRWRDALKQKQDLGRALQRVKG